MNIRYALLGSAASIILTAAAGPAAAQSTVFTTPHLTTATGSQSVDLGGVTFVNQGLIGVGRLDAGVRDFAGESLGSFSGMALDLASWRRNADGTYSGRMFTLPDRGPNDVGPFVGTTDYRNRVHISNLTFTPYTGAAALPQATGSQNQLAIVPSGGFFLIDGTGANFTGKDAGSNVITRNGIAYPSPAAGEGAGRISLDSEAIAFARDGSFYVSDEYAANIYHFDANGHQLGAIQTVPAILPRTAGAINFNGAGAPDTGRRNNQGLEALAITSDGKKLVTILQSATVQDTDGSNQNTRNNTRILVYDISGGATPAAPIGHYVLQLPTFTQNGGGGPVNRTAAQSEMLALNDTQFLVLSRDGIGRGSGASATNSPVFKSVLLVDISGATNIAGTGFETGTTPVATAGSLAPGIIPVQQVELVNMLNPVQLGRFGMNLNTAPSDATSLSEKWEALGLAPVLEEAAPKDFFLFVGNDNDFMTANGLINGQAFDASLSGAGGSGNNDSVILVYRLTLPTYVDPEALAAMVEGAPQVLVGARTLAAEVGTSANGPALHRLASLRRTDGGSGGGIQLWLEGHWSRATAAAAGLSDVEADGFGVAGGVDIGFGSARIGVGVGHTTLEGDFGVASAIEAKGTSIAVYGGVVLPSGFYMEAAASKTIDLKLGRIERPSAYGQTGLGRTDGDAWAAGAEAGWLFGFGNVKAGPFAGIEYVDVSLDGFTETGASVSNLVYGDLDYSRTRGSLGIEARVDVSPSVRPTLRAGYAIEEEHGDRRSTVRLASAQHAMGTQSVALADTERNRAFVSGGIDGSLGAVRYGVSAEGRFGRGEDEARASFVISLGL